MNRVEGCLFSGGSFSHAKCNAVGGCVSFYMNSEPLGEDVHIHLPIVMCLSFSQAFQAPQK